MAQHENQGRGRWLAALALGVALALVPATAGWFWWNSLRLAADPLRRGLDAYARGDWETAAKVARERIKEFNDDLAAVQLLARTSVRMGRDSLALSLFNRLGPDFMTADDFYLLGIAVSRTGNPKGSVEVWEQGLKANPDHPETLDALIPVYLEDELFQAAAEAADAPGQTSPVARSSPNRVASNSACPGRSGRGHRLLTGVFQQPAGRICRHHRAAGHSQEPGSRLACRRPARRSSSPVANGLGPRA